MNNALTTIMLLYSNLADRRIHCSLSRSAIAMLVDIQAVTESNAFIVVLLKILRLTFRFGGEGEGMEEGTFIKTIRVLYGGVYIHCYAVCRRTGRALYIEMIIHEPRNR